MTKKMNRGFTLIELMIVVAIIGILAAIAIPNFIRYQLRSKSTEAKTVLGGIKTSEESFRAEYDNYSGAAAVPAAPGNTVKIQFTSAACMATCNRLVPADCTTFACLGYQPSGQVYYQYGAVQTVIAMAGAAAPAEFGAAARSDLDGDGNFGSFGYGTSNDEAVALTVGDPAAALAGIPAPCAAGTAPAGEVVDCAPNTY